MEPGEITSFVKKAYVSTESIIRYKVGGKRSGLQNFHNNLKVHTRSEWAPFPQRTK